MLLWLLICVNAAVGTAPTTAGFQFLISFMENVKLPGQYPFSQCLLITTTNTTPVAVNITTLYPGYSFNASLAVNYIKGAHVCLPNVVQIFTTRISSKTTEIQSNYAVSVTVLEGQLNSMDMYVAIPTHLYGYDYYVVSFSSKSNSEFQSEFTVTAVANQTNITLEFPKTSYYELEYQGVTLLNPKTLIITLLEGEVFQLQNLADLTGVYISADQPIGVVSGHEATGTSHFTNTDHMAQQMTPIVTWGTDFVTVVTPRAMSNYSDVYRVLASSPNTTVTVDLSSFQLENEGDWFETNISSRFPSKISSNNAVIVVKYVFNSQYIDTCMMIIVPNEQWTSKYVFTLGRGIIESVYLILVVKTSAASSLTLNGETMSIGNWRQVPATDKLVGYMIIDENTYVIKSETGKSFMAYIHQFSAQQAFCSPVGMKLEPINDGWTHTAMEACPLTESSPYTYPSTTMASTTTVVTTTKAPTTTMTTTTVPTTTTKQSTTTTSTTTESISTIASTTTGSGVSEEPSNMSNITYCTCKENNSRHGSFNTSDEELEEMVRLIKQNLYINPNTTSKHIRSKISIPDFRPVPMSLGVFGSVMVALTMCIVCLQDLNHIRNYCLMNRWYKTQTNTRVNNDLLIK